MDNLSYHITILHTVSEVEQKEYLKVYPNPTRGRVNIQAKKNNEFHIIEKMELINANGQVVQEFGVSPTKFYIDIDDHPDVLRLMFFRNCCISPLCHKTSKIR